MLLKSLQWRLVFIFVLLVLAVMMIVGVILLDRVESIFFTYFHTTVRDGFEKFDIESKTPQEIVEIFKDKNQAGFWFGIYGIDGNCQLLDLDFYPQDSGGKRAGRQIEVSYNLAKAMKDGIGDNKRSSREGAFFDYARKVKLADGREYIFYIRYSKDKWGSILDSIRNSIIISLLFAMAVSFLLGYILSKTITVPVRNLTNKAKMIASGNFDNLGESTSLDEIGQLTRSFNHMARELKNTLNQISSEKNKVQTILQYMADGVAAFNTKGEVIHANAAVEKMLNTAILNETLEGFVNKLNIGIPADEILGLKQQHIIEKIVSYYDTFLGIYFAPFTDEKNNTGGVIAVIQDITEQHKLEMMRREFVANVSHELRTPLTSIKSYSETLLDGAMEDREICERFLKVINNESDRMTRLVKDLLQLSRLDYKQEQWKKQEFDFNDVVSEAVEKLSIECENKGQSLSCNTFESEIKLNADRDRIEQVVLNLVSNAIKYTPEKGSISVKTGIKEGHAILEVTDTGMGIPEADLPRIFERFYRVDKARSRELGGTGLGLSIAREIVEAHGGSIEITSKDNQGTKVFVKLPMCNLNVNAV